MSINIEEKSLELKSYVSQYDTKTFLGDLSTLLQMVPMQNIPYSLEGLVAPQRQLFYLAGLHLTSKKDENEEVKYQYTEEEWDHIKILLIEIENGYEEKFYPNDGEVLDDIDAQKRIIALMYHLNYFNQGDLNYEEQIIERVLNYFAPFENEIQAHFGLTLSEFISVYRFLDEMLHQKLNSVLPSPEDKTWDDIGLDKFVEGITNPDKMHLAVPESYIRMSESLMDPGKKYRFTLKELIDEFGSNISNAFIDALCVKRQESAFLYYTEINPYFNYPIFEVDKNEYQSMDIKQIIIAIYNQLLDFVVSKSSITEAFYKHRGNELENKIVNLFKSLFGEEAFVYQSYYTEVGNEQDILILYKGMALIIEAKASKRREPRSDPDKAYGLIRTNFDKVIQKGYDQAFRVKEKFLKGEKFYIYEDLALKNQIIQINTKNYHSVFSLIVTLERFGQIQTDLDSMIDIDERDEMPLSICIDDLEVFLLSLKKRGFKFSELLRYLNLREYLHGGLLCGDELEICGAILDKQIPDKLLKSDKIIKTHPDHAKMFDDYYHEGLGFENEINLDRKTSGKFITLFR
ncbi:hypothetical protein [Aestuariibaculum sediminum]|uniref:NERD domain-containing protein n=1 Tax=Aestuariibaculum sediminum TaxID=2770637 RepID=A0A8J6Q980_9FLAO|nr:hypothetical protein [Aestuariibaculum sediminum]MBD0833360.1 hypothetical protein [Aestuariibaculum sediminum]